jgi:hypothetical protein
MLSTQETINTIYIQSGVHNVCKLRYQNVQTDQYYQYLILWKYFYSLAPIFVVSTKCIDPWVLEFMVLNITGNNPWEWTIFFSRYWNNNICKTIWSIQNISKDYCEIIINCGVLIFADFVVHLNSEIKIQPNSIFPWIVACNV